MNTNDSVRRRKGFLALVLLCLLPASVLVSPALVSELIGANNRLMFLCFVALFLVGSFFFARFDLRSLRYFVIWVCFLFLINIIGALRGSPIGPAAIAFLVTSSFYGLLLCQKDNDYSPLAPVLAIFLGFYTCVLLMHVMVAYFLPNLFEDFVITDTLNQSRLYKNLNGFMFIPEAFLTEDGSRGAAKNRFVGFMSEPSQFAFLCALNFVFASTLKSRVLQWIVKSVAILGGLSTLSTTFMILSLVFLFVRISEKYGRLFVFLLTTALVVLIVLYFLDGFNPRNTSFLVRQAMMAAIVESFSVGDLLFGSPAENFGYPSMWIQFLIDFGLVFCLIVAVVFYKAGFFRGDTGIIIFIFSLTLQIQIVATYVVPVLVARSISCKGRFG